MTLLAYAKTKVLIFALQIFTTKIAIQYMDVLIMVAQLILSLSILIVLHEGGHFFPAKFFGIKVEKFYLFFDPYFSLFKFKKGETEYGIGWLPLGGYVKIAGMIDESFDKEQMAKDPEPWEFRSKPAWQRLIVMIGGVTVNFILGFLIFGAVLFTWGDDFLPAENVKYGVYADSLATAIGFQEGDIPIGVNGDKLVQFSHLRRDMIIKEATTVQVKRNGQTVDIPISKEHITQIPGYKGDFLLPRFPFEIDTVLQNKPGAKAGFKENDKIIAFNGKPSLYFTDFLANARDNKNKEVAVTVLRGSDTLTLNPVVSEEGRVGIGAKSQKDYLEFQHRDYTFGEALPAGYHKGMEFLSNTIKSFALMFKGTVKAKDSLGSFISIGKLFSPSWDWHSFWNITAMLSLILAFMNILPIPLLDGGHVMFLLYEMVTGRLPNERFQEIASMIGLFLLMALMLYAIGLDIFRALGWI